MRLLCLARRIALIVFGVAAVGLSTGMVPHPSARLAQALMYVALAVAILALGAGWRPRKIQPNA